MPHRLLRRVILSALTGSTTLDLAKKGLFYGKDAPALREERIRLEHDVDLLPGLAYDDSVLLVHAILGIRTEADELLRLLYEKLTGVPVTNAELADEAGDLGWYLQLLANAIGKTSTEVVAGNVAKLLVRFPNGYESDRAINPNKAAEAAAQEAA